MTPGQQVAALPAAKIVGRGVISGSGRGVEAFWPALRAANPGMRAADPGDERLEAPHYVRITEPRDAPEDLASFWIDLAVREALEAAAPVLDTLDQPRITLLGGTSLGGMTLFESEHRAWWGDGTDPLPLPPWRAAYFGPASLAGQRFANHGGWTLNTACSSAANGLGLARLWLARNRCDVVIVVGYDVVSPFVFAGFSGLNAVDQQATNPFGSDRRGLNMGEAAVALVLCRASDVPREHPGARIVGYGSSCDAHHLTRPDLSGAGLQRAIRWALRDARCAAADIGFISAHGTGTPFNDTMESAAFEGVFGDERPPMHCAKPVTGHTLGASGAIDTLVVTLAFEHGLIPATYARTTPDPELAFHPSIDEKPLTEGSLALSTSSGFGGSNAALVLAPAGTDS